MSWAVAIHRHSPQRIYVQQDTSGCSLSSQSVASIGLTGGLLLREWLRGVLAAQHTASEDSFRGAATP